MPLNLKEINKYLAEGLECKELLVEKSKEISILDTTIVYYKKINVNLAKEISAGVKKEECYKAEIDSVDNKFIESQLKNHKLELKAKDESIRKHRWRTFALGEAGFILLSVIAILSLR